MDKGREINKFKNDRLLSEISDLLGRLDTKFWVVIILLIGILVVAIADL